MLFILRINLHITKSLDAYRKKTLNLKNKFEYNQLNKLKRNLIKAKESNQNCFKNRMKVCNNRLMYLRNK